MAIGLLAKQGARPRRGAYQDDLFETANLFPGDTGLPVTIWVRPRGRARHAARIKVSRLAGNRMVPSNTLVVRLEPEPALITGKLPSNYLEPMLRWASENRDILLQYWNGQIGTGALVSGLKRLRAPDAGAD